MQDALLKALQAFAEAQGIAREESWLFKIAHNVALDALRVRGRVELAGESLDTVVDPASLVEAALSTPASMRMFMRLPVSQRSAVILMDVLEYSLDEIGETMGLSLPAVKSALHRGRTRLNALGADEPPDATAPPIEDEVSRKLVAYIDRFNAGDFDAVRNMLAEEVRLDLVNRTRLEGREQVRHYFHNYSQRPHYQWVLGTVDGRPALLCRDSGRAEGGFMHFALLEWKNESVSFIRDFIHAPYVLQSAVVATL